VGCTRCCNDRLLSALVITKDDGPIMTAEGAQYRWTCAIWTKR